MSIEREQPPDECVRVGNGDAHLERAVVAGRHLAASGELPPRPPGHLCIEDHGGDHLLASRLPRRLRYRRGGVEVRGPDERVAGLTRCDSLGAVHPEGLHRIGRTGFRPDHVPVPAPVDEPVRSDHPRPTPVAEVEQAAVGDGREDGRQFLLVGPQIRGERLAVIGHRSTSQFEQRLRPGGTAAEVDHLCCEPQRGALLVGQAGVRQRVVLRRDHVPVLDLPRVRRSELERNAEPAQQVLVAFEHPARRFVAGLVVAVDGGPDLVRRHRPVDGEQEREEIENALDDVVHAARSV